MQGSYAQSLTGTTVPAGCGPLGELLNISGLCSKINRSSLPHRDCYEELTEAAGYSVSMTTAMRAFPTLWQRALKHELSAAPKHSEPLINSHYCYFSIYCSF